MRCTRPPLVLPLALAAAFAAPAAALAQTPEQHAAVTAADSLATAPPPAGTPAAPPALRALATTGAPRVDGSLDDDVWAAAPVAAGFVQQQPEPGRRASQPTEVRVLVTADAIYVGARMRDAEPDRVVARLARRDQAVHADWFYVYLDTYRDRRSAYGFGVSAAGVQRDLRLSADQQEDASWDAVWGAAVRRDGEGWTAELRIPLGQLRFGSGEAGSAWGLNFERRIARRNEVAYWAPVPEDAGRFVSLFGTLEEAPRAAPGRGIEVVPYTVARLTALPDASAGTLLEPLAPGAAMGVDVRARVTSDFTLSATVNPDFGQVEADPAQVNLSAFEIFQSERRPFFVEGADLLELSFPSWPPLFYSRRIGRAPQLRVPGPALEVDAPSATTILAAAKLTGRTQGGWSVGALQAVTGEESARFLAPDSSVRSAPVEPLTSYSVARVARQFRQGRTGVGVLGTLARRRLDDGQAALLPRASFGLGADAWHRFGGDVWEARLGVLGSQVRGDTAAIRRVQTAPGHYYQRPDAAHVELDPTRDALGGYSAAASVRKLRGTWRAGVYAEATSPGFDVADVGFNSSLDLVSANAWLRYYDLTPGTFLRSWRLGGTTMTQRTFGGERLELTQDLGFDFQTLAGWGGGVWVMRHQPAWTTTHLRGGPALRKPGRWMGNVRGSTDPRRSLVGSTFVFWEVEDEAAGHRLMGNGSLRLRTSPRLEWSVGPSFTLNRDAWQYVGAPRVDGSPLYLVQELDQRTLSLVTRADYTASPRLSLQLYVRPYLSAGRYEALREVVEPGAGSFEDRFRTYGDEAVETVVEGRRALAVDRDGDGESDLTFRTRDFNSRSFQLNAVLRWEYLPGSTLYVVWSHDRGSFARTASDVGHDLRELKDVGGRNVLLVKAAYWLQM